MEEKKEEQQRKEREEQRKDKMTALLVGFIASLAGVAITWYYSVPGDEWIAESILFLRLRASAPPFESKLDESFKDLHPVGLEGLLGNVLSGYGWHRLVGEGFSGIGKSHFITQRLAGTDALYISFKKFEGRSMKAFLRTPFGLKNKESNPFSVLESAIISMHKRTGKPVVIVVDDYHNPLKRDKVAAAGFIGLLIDLADNGIVNFLLLGSEPLMPLIDDADTVSRSRLEDGQIEPIPTKQLEQPVLKTLLKNHKEGPEPTLEDAQSLVDEVGSHMASIIKVATQPSVAAARAEAARIVSEAKGGIEDATKGKPDRKVEILRLLSANDSVLLQQEPFTPAMKEFVAPNIVRIDRADRSNRARFHHQSLASAAKLLKPKFCGDKATYEALQKVGLTNLCDAKK